MDKKILETEYFEDFRLDFSAKLSAREKQEKNVARKWEKSYQPGKPMVSVRDIVDWNQQYVNKKITETLGYIFFSCMTWYPQDIHCW